MTDTHRLPETPDELTADERALGEAIAVLIETLDEIRESLDAPDDKAA